MRTSRDGQARRGSTQISRKKRSTEQEVVLTFGVNLAGHTAEPSATGADVPTVVVHGAIGPEGARVLVTNTFFPNGGQDVHAAQVGRT